MYFTMCVWSENTDRKDVLNVPTDIVKTDTQPMNCNKCVWMRWIIIYVNSTYRKISETEPLRMSETL